MGWSGGAVSQYAAYFGPDDGAEHCGDDGQDHDLGHARFKLADTGSERTAFAFVGDGGVEQLPQLALKHADGAEDLAVGGLTHQLTACGR